MFSRGNLSGAAKEALKITRESCVAGRDRNIVAAMLMVDGDEAPPTDAEFLVCRWPNESALLVAETFFEPGAPLTRLKFEHTRSKWAAVAAYGRVQNTLLIWLERKNAPPPERVVNELMAAIDVQSIRPSSRSHQAVGQQAHFRRAQPR